MTIIVVLEFIRRLYFELENYFDHNVEVSTPSVKVNTSILLGHFPQ